MKKKYKPLSLSGATKILRAHATQIMPPALREFLNAYLSRSDNSISLRSDWEPIGDVFESYAPYLQQSDVRDYLAGDYSVVTAGHHIFFSRLIPFTGEGEVAPLYSIYDEGTITTDGSRTLVAGTDTEWLQMAWVGCFVREKGEGNDLYLVTRVNSNVSLQTEQPMPALTDAEYELVRCHHHEAAIWPLRFDGLGNFLVYNAVNPSVPVDETKICGPFFSNIGRPNLGVWFGQYPDIQTGIHLVALCCGTDDGVQERIRYYHGQISVAFGNAGGMFTQPRNEINASFCDPGTVIDILTGFSTFEDWSFYYCLSNGNLFHVAFDDFLNHATPPEGVREIYCHDKTITDLGSVLDGAVVRGKVQMIIYATPGYGYYYGDGGKVVYETGNCSTQTELDLFAGFQNFRIEGDAVAVIVGDLDTDLNEAIVLRRAATASAGPFTKISTGISKALHAAISSQWARDMDYDGATTELLCRGAVFGDDGTIFTTDDDGLTWDDRTPDPELSVFTNTYRAVGCTEGGAITVAVGDAGQAVFSHDLINWWFDPNYTWDTERDFIDVSFNKDIGEFIALDTEGELQNYYCRPHLRADVHRHVGKCGYNMLCVKDVYRGWHANNVIVAVGSFITWTVAEEYDPEAEPANWTLGKNASEETFYPSNRLCSVAGDFWAHSSIVAVGEGGTICRSVDDGEHWEEVYSGTTKNLYGVVGPNQFMNYYIAVGENGTVLKSTDAGATWAQESSFNWDTDLYCVCRMMTSEQYIFAAGQDGRVYELVYKDSILYPWAIYPDENFQGTGAPIYCMESSENSGIVLVSDGKIFTLTAAYDNAGGKFTGPVYEFEWTNSAGEPVIGCLNGIAQSPKPFQYNGPYPIVIWGYQGEMVTSCDDGMKWSFVMGETYGQGETWGGIWAVKRNNLNFNLCCANGFGQFWRVYPYTGDVYQYYQWDAVFQTVESEEET